MKSADDCWTDHRLIHSTMAIKIVSQRRLQGRKPRHKMNTQALQDLIKWDCFQTALKDHLLLEFPDNIEEHWTKLKTSMIAAYEQAVGYQTPRNGLIRMTVRLNALLTRKGRPFRSGKEIETVPLRQKPMPTLRLRFKEEPEN
ncbi:Hypothetical predicted protein [Podarcis lilfordi]|uniref:Uncharacterized protein n=1 Tax=Podarcis lilfordi TaxID=74358 RepID=A0AA35K2V3_9SAUR|nr:Hypothetical predicted protein [Podarcis lilfordi]